MERISNTLPKYIIMTASAAMPASCRGKYGKIALVELEPGRTEPPKMISERARGIVRIVRCWDKLNMGKTNRCAYAVAMKEAEDLLAVAELLGA